MSQAPAPAGTQHDDQEPGALAARVIRVLVSTLGIEERAPQLDEGTPLLDSLPELDSMAIVELILALEEEFDVEIDEGEVTGDAFETIGTLTELVADQITAAAG
jgi:acyl carrier protein